MTPDEREMIELREENESLRAALLSSDADRQRIDLLEALRVVSMYFADGSQLNTGSQSLRSALDCLKPFAFKASSAARSPEGEPNG